jgi:undecaprenyl diphosphate synthase
MPTQPALDPLEAVGVPREAMPRSIAVIMDGNGRWAQRRGLPRIEGHRNSSVAVRETVTQCARLGVEALTLYSFSLENWKRPAAEVAGLMELYTHYLAAERQTILENDIRVVQIGRREGLPDAVLHELDLTLEASADNSGLTLCLALNYGSRDEICDAVRDIARQVQRGELSPDAIDEAVISNHLYTAGIRDPDLVIRTAGQMRISNFLLWQISYAELVITDVLWPDFRAAQLYDAIREYARRERRFGDVHSAGATPPRGG